MISCGPMTMIVAAVLVGCFVAGLVILFRAAFDETSSGPKDCPRCRNSNPKRAKFCAGCGRKLDK